MPTKLFRTAALAAASAAALAVSVPASATALVRDGFAFVEVADAKIVVFRPDVHVGSMSAGGLDQPNAEWTEAARANIQAALVDAMNQQNAEVEFLDELEGENAETLNAYRALFEAVVQSIAVHSQSAERLPSKGEEREAGPGRSARRSGVQLDWTLGEGASQLRDATGADYAMMIFTHDSYGDDGRKAAQVAGMLGCIIGACVIIQAGVHVGYAGLVDLRTGNIVWFNTDPSIGGDPRDPEGAVERVQKLLEDFPQPVPATELALAQ